MPGTVWPGMTEREPTGPTGKRRSQHRGHLLQPVLQCVQQPLLAVSGGGMTRAPIWRCRRRGSVDRWQRSPPAARHPALQRSRPPSRSRWPPSLPRRRHRPRDVRNRCSLASAIIEELSGVRRPAIDPFPPNWRVLPGQRLQLIRRRRSSRWRRTPSGSVESGISWPIRPAGTRRRPRGREEAQR